MKAQKKYVVVMNLGGGLWDHIVEVKRKEDYNYDNTRDDYWVDSTGDLSWREKQGPRNDSGCAYHVFDTKQEAQLFFQGAQAFQGFMYRFFKAAK